jgi:hypothetical protein
VAFITHEYFREAAENQGLTVWGIGKKDAYAEILDNPKLREKKPTVMPATLQMLLRHSIYKLDEHLYVCDIYLP